MRTFISEVAQDLYERYGSGVSELKVVFPSRRAQLFFVDALSSLAERPMWQPRFVTVDEMMREVSGLETCDHIRLITELYKVYSEYHNETFDSFYFWGDMLLSDFDSIDKYLIDARMLFANIDDLRSIEDDFSFLSPEQVAAIRQFWRNFGLEGEFSKEKEHFINIWRSLGDIYDGFRQRLQESGIAYTGMMYRAAADVLSAGGAGSLDVDEGSKYVIVGFNALSECEKRLFRYLQGRGIAEFYWDYDNYYVGNQWHEAGMFLRENIRAFPAKSGNGFHSHFEGHKDITIVSCASDSLQCKYVYDFLSDLLDRGVEIDKRTAIVLTDESLLLPVLHSIPDGVGQVNVTMGYPLRQTTAYSFVERLIELQNRRRSSGGRLQFYHSDVTGILGHPYVLEQYAAHATGVIESVRRFRRVYVDRDAICGGIPLLEHIFSAQEDRVKLSAYITGILSEVGAMPSSEEDTARRREYFSVIIEHVIKLGNSLVGCDVELTLPVYVSLLRRTLQNVRIPYEGEPLAGLQIMGILETRNLDFENLLVLSLNDDTFPGNRSVNSSFIPYNLRVAYGLPTPLHHEGVYGYYFYRLLQRARRIHLAYCSRNDERKSGEQSRYLYQLRYESGKDVSLKTLSLGIYSPQERPLEVAKEGEVWSRLELFLKGKKILSPTSFYSYVECPMKFYYRSVASLRPEEEVQEEVDMLMFGTILHKAMELLYSAVLDVEDQSAAIRALIGSHKVDEAVVRAINSEFLKEDGVAESEYNGNLLLIRDIVHKYIDRCILPFDAARAGVRIESLERHISAPFSFTVGAGADGRGVAARQCGDVDERRCGGRPDGRSGHVRPGEPGLSGPQAEGHVHSGESCLPVTQGGAVDSVLPGEVEFTVPDASVRPVAVGVTASDASGQLHEGGKQHEVATPRQEYTVLLGGIADRIDRTPEGLRVVDYKTGMSRLEFKGIEALFGTRHDEHNSAVLQTLIYSLVLNINEGVDVQPSLYYIRQMNDEGYSPLLIDGHEPVISLLPYKEQLTGELRKQLSVLFDRSTPFRLCDDVKTCQYCDFRELCRR